MVRLAMGAVLLLGCGGPPFDAVATCAADGFATSQLHFETPLDCAYYAEALWDAQTRIIEAGFSDAPAIRRAVSGVDVWVRETSGPFECGPDTYAWGCYDPGTERIEVGRTGASLAHELLHRIGHVERREVCGHPDWGRRGAPAGAPVVGEFEGAPVYRGSWLDVADRFETHWETQARLRGVRP